MHHNIPVPVLIILQIFVVHSQGDSGGPMACRHRQTGLWDLVGVTSWGIGCADAGYPDVLARVSRFQNWIRTTVDSNGGP